MSISTAKFVVQRDDVQYSVSGEDLQSKLQPDDIIVINRNNIDYNYTIDDIFNDIKDDDYLVITDVDNVTYKVSGEKFLELFIDPLLPDMPPFISGIDVVGQTVTLDDPGTTTGGTPPVNHTDTKWYLHTPGTDSDSDKLIEEEEGGTVSIIDENLPPAKWNGQSGPGMTYRIQQIDDFLKVSYRHCDRYKTYQGFTSNINSELSISTQSDGNGFDTYSSSNASYDTVYFYDTNSIVRLMVSYDFLNSRHYWHDSSGYFKVRTSSELSSESSNYSFSKTGLVFKGTNISVATGGGSETLDYLNIIGTVLRTPVHWDPHGYVEWKWEITDREYNLYKRELDPSTKIPYQNWALEGTYRLPNNEYKSNWYRGYPINPVINDNQPNPICAGPFHVVMYDVSTSTFEAIFIPDPGSLSSSWTNDPAVDTLKSGAPGDLINGKIKTAFLTLDVATKTVEEFTPLTYDFNEILTGDGSTSYISSHIINLSYDQPAYANRVHISKDTQTYPYRILYYNVFKANSNELTIKPQYESKDIYATTTWEDSKEQSVIMKSNVISDIKPAPPIQDPVFLTVTKSPVVTIDRDGKIVVTPHELNVADTGRPILKNDISYEVEYFFEPVAIYDEGAVAGKTHEEVKALRGLQRLPYLDTSIGYAKTWDVYWDPASPDNIFTAFVGGQPPGTINGLNLTGNGTNNFKMVRTDKVLITLFDVDSKLSIFSFNDISGLRLLRRIDSQYKNIVTLNPGYLTGQIDLHTDTSPYLARVTIDMSSADEYSAVTSRITAYVDEYNLYKHLGLPGY